MKSSCASTSMSYGRRAARRPLTEAEREKIAALEDARTSARKYGKGTRFWQDVVSIGGEQLRKTLGLDNRPVVLLPTNVLGDTLTLGRNIFTASMAEWIEKTVQYFAGRQDVQLVVRVHPGERLMKGPSMQGVIERALPERPGTHPCHRADGKDQHLRHHGDRKPRAGLHNDRGPGDGHARRAGHRGREYALPRPGIHLRACLAGMSILPCSRRSFPTCRGTLDPEQVETAWNYAYRFFFEFPLDFPWRLMHFWKDVEVWPLEARAFRRRPERIRPNLSIPGRRKDTGNSWIEQS